MDKLRQAYATEVKSKDAVQKLNDQLQMELNAKSAIEEQIQAELKEEKVCLFFACLTL